MFNNLIPLLLAGCTITFAFAFSGSLKIEPPKDSNPPSGTAPSSNGDIQIYACNGSPGPAHFRAYPALEGSAIKGAVAQGDWVSLTGNTTFSDSVLWHEARNRSPLEPAAGGFPGNYQSDANQLGWIADCFVK
jgi:hypothetical protein